jgi:hypothetical protein
MLRDSVPRPRHFPASWQYRPPHSSFLISYSLGIKNEALYSRLQEVQHHFNIHSTTRGRFVPKCSAHDFTYEKDRDGQSNIWTIMGIRSRQPDHHPTDEDNRYRTTSQPTLACKSCRRCALSSCGSWDGEIVTLLTWYPRSRKIKWWAGQDQIFGQRSGIIDDDIFIQQSGAPSLLDMREVYAALPVSIWAVETWTKIGWV